MNCSCVLIKENRVHSASKDGGVYTKAAKMWVEDSSSWGHGEGATSSWEQGRQPGTELSKRLRHQHPRSTPKEHRSPCRDGHPETWTSHLWPWGWARQRAAHSGSRFPETRGPEPCFDQVVVSDGFWELCLRKWKKTFSTATWLLK